MAALNFIGLLLSWHTTCPSMEIDSITLFSLLDPKAAHYYYEKGGETQRLHVNRGIASNLRKPEQRGFEL